MGVKGMSKIQCENKLNTYTTNNPNANLKMTMIGKKQVCASAVESNNKVGPQRQKQEPADACEGDSGGPVVRFIKNKNSELKAKKRAELVGITSFGIGCKDNIKAKLPTVYTQVSKYMHWIRKHVSVMYTVNG